MKVSDYLIKEIEKITDAIFLVPGGGIMHLVDSVRKSNLKAYCCHHEQAAVIAAEGYSRMAYPGEMGVALVTTGPGGSNAVTGVAGAWLDSIPILVIGGQVKTNNMRTGKERSLGFQELNVIDLMRPITKWAGEIVKPYTMEIERAVLIAKNKRPGPVFLEVPLDVQASKIRR
jgi:acetolactate synthase-1/2/3 large subunit